MLNIAISNQMLFRQIRTAHTDIKVPDFDHIRRGSLQCADMKSTESEDSRKTCSYMIVGTAATVGLYGLKSEVTRYVSYLSASADVLALSKIEINLADVPEGKSVTFKWRGKPLFIRHRTAEQIAAARAVPVGSLRDPMSDEERCRNPSFLVVIGVCTHLGCIPIADAGDFGPGGYYCPCHGSHFDGAARVRKGPAPLNLVIPEHTYVGETGLIVG
ncbi:hypothetical protein NQ314_016199 [Rhamnusium bicolor]|uniref:Cytochrome b-c1 complex subunit Rieske, mitochondrial n=1 Tax=Rhamnusium bicolor TaxID=1586634 RepID=A0AAV8WXU7_9CUCU|nr:hypothetical protein NQ314_016199 [Rhamnusium bicolor]